MKTSIVLIAVLLAEFACLAQASDVLRTSDRPFRLDQSEMAVDKVPPKPPVLGCTLIWRGWGSDGVEASKYSASQKAFVQFVVEGATDDRTKPGELGYRFELVQGKLPEGLTIPDACLAGVAGDVYLKWDDGATWQQDAFCFSVRVVALDKAGNTSKPSNAVIVCNDGDMTYMRQQARLIYARAAANAAESMAASQLDLPAEMPSNLPEKEPAGKPATISDVYKAATIEALKKIKNVRVDRVEYRSQRMAIESYDLSQLTVRESGRALTADEVTQLTQLLLRPQSYTTDIWGGTFDSGYAFLSDDLDHPFYIVVNQASYQVGIGDSETRDAGNLSREAASILLGFCDGLFKLGTK